MQSTRPSGTAAVVESSRGHASLVVDGEPAIRKVMDRPLGRAGYEILLAANGPGAIRLFEQHAPDVG